MRRLENTGLGGMALFLGNRMDEDALVGRIIFVATLALLAAFGANGQINNPSVTTVNIPPPAVDWFARTVSGLAFVVALAAFIWGRVDKHLERKAAKAARDPSVDLDITTGNRPGNYDYELKIINRGDVSVQVVSFSCDARAILKPEEAEVSQDSRTVNYRGFRIERGNSHTLMGEVDCEIAERGPIEFTVMLRINETEQRLLKVVLKRDLP
jgi:hypothetical protein